MLDKNFSKLFSEIEDKRKDKHNVAILCPVGDIEMLKNFLMILKEQSFQEYDLFLIYPKNLDFFYDDNFSIIHIREKLPLGTSGCFFAGQSFLYKEGYDTIVVADIDAVPLEKNMLELLIQEAKKSNCLCVPLSVLDRDNIIMNEKYYVINQYGTYHRSVFDKVGFATPFFWRGAEDWEMMMRVIDKKLLKLVDALHVQHPREGIIIYEKMVNKSKFYPYISGLLKAFLFRSLSNKRYLIGYMARHLFYRFFSIVFRDSELKTALEISPTFRIQKYVNKDSGYLEIQNIGPKISIINSPLTNFYILLELLVFGKSRTTSKFITLKKRSTVFLNTLVAFIYIPMSLLESISNIIKWRNEQVKVVYPVYPKNLEKTIEIYAGYVKNGYL